MGAATFGADVARRLEAIRNDREHGATFLAGEALGVLKLAAEESPSGSARVSTVRELAYLLVQARPAMAAIGNMVRRFIKEMKSKGDGFDPRELECELLVEMERASRQAAQRAAELVYDDARVLTCSYSSAVLRSFKVAMASGKRLNVAALESGAGDRSYGQRVVEEVEALGIAATLVPDHAISEAVSGSDMVLVGADKFLHTGRIVNGWPSLELARAAKGAVPFYVVGESFKLDSDPSTEEGFDLVPDSLITRIITDIGP